MTKKYVIRSSVCNTYVSNTDKWLTDCWTENINEAKVFEDFDDALNGLMAIAHYFNSMYPSNRSEHAIHEVVTTLGNKITVDNKDTVLKLLDAIQCCGVRKVDVPDMQRIINYVKAKGN